MFDQKRGLKYLIKIGIVHSTLDVETVGKNEDKCKAFENDFKLDICRHFARVISKLGSTIYEHIYSQNGCFSELNTEKMFDEKSYDKSCALYQERRLI